MIVECVPNFSEGRDPAIIASLGNAVQSTEGASLLDTSWDVDHNRSVLTFAGSPGAVGAAALDVVRVAASLIDLSSHTGVHPRLGAADVVPFVPVSGVSLADCAELARTTGQRIWEELRIPVYLYEAAALRPECVRLENIRKLVAGGLVPDFGDKPHPTAGVCVVGARKFLIAWNVNLLTSDVSVARAIAREIRESSGGLPGVKAKGFPLRSRAQAQVSINLVDYEQTPLHAVFDAVVDRCKARGIEIAGSELIGMIPAAALAASSAHNLKWENLRPDLVLENRLSTLH